MAINAVALTLLCAELTRDLLAIAKLRYQNMFSSQFQQILKNIPQTQKQTDTTGNNATHPQTDTHC